MLQDGARGFQPLGDPMDNDEDVAEYGIDWDAYHDQRIYDHHAISNPMDPFPRNPFVAHQPETLNVIQVDESRCPFTQEELRTFTYNISLLPESLRFSWDMCQRKELFILSLNICKQIKG